MIFPPMLKYNNGFYHLLQSSLHILCLLLLKNFRFVTGFLKFIFCSLLFQIATAYCGVFLEIYVCLREFLASLRRQRGPYGHFFPIFSPKSPANSFKNHFTENMPAETLANTSILEKPGTFFKKHHRIRDLFFYAIVSDSLCICPCTNQGCQPNYKWAPPA